MRKFSSDSSPTSAATVNVTTALTTLTPIEGNSMADDVGFELLNAGAIALTDLQLQVRYNANGDYFTVVAAADWAAIIAGTQGLSSFLTSCSTTNPATLAASAKSWFTVNMKGIESLRIQAKTGSSATNITTLFNGRTAR